MYSVVASCSLKVPITLFLLLECIHLVPKTSINQSINQSILWHPRDAQDFYELTPVPSLSTPAHHPILILSVLSSAMSLGLSRPILPPDFHSGISWTDSSLLLKMCPIHLHLNNLTTSFTLGKPHILHYLLYAVAIWFPESFSAIYFQTQDILHLLL